MTENDTASVPNSVLVRVANLEEDIASLRAVLDATIEGFQALKRLVDFDAKQAGGP